MHGTWICGHDGDHCLLALCCLLQEGNTALIRASENGHLEVLRLLLNAGADSNVQNKV